MNTRLILLHLFWISTCASMAATAAEPMGKEHCQKAFPTFKDRLTKNPADETAWIELRVCAGELKKWDEAIQLALQARLKNKELPQPYLILGLAQMHQKNYDRAIEHFDQTISLRSNQPVAYFQMGMAYLYLNEPGKAAQAAERATDLEPDNPSYHRQLGYTYLLLGDLEAAERSVKKAIELDTDDIASHKILAKIYTKAGDSAGAKAEVSLIEASEKAFAAAHPELVKKPEPEPKPAAKQEEEDDEHPRDKMEDYQIIGICIGQWTKMKEAMMRGQTEEALAYYSDYLDTRDQYRASFQKMGDERLKAIFGAFGELYDCDVFFAAAHCKAMMQSPAGGVVVTKIRFERNPDKVWRIRSF